MPINRAGFHARGLGLEAAGWLEKWDDNPGSEPFVILTPAAAERLVVELQTHPVDAGRLVGLPNDQEWRASVWGSRGHLTSNQA
jgi:hypothetical protein